MLKKCVEAFARPIKIVFTGSLEVVVVPEMRKGKCLAVYKKGDWEIALYYRPVSLRSMVCETLEKNVGK